MKRLILVSAFIASNAFAVDTFNASNGQLTIPSVNVSGVIYNNVVVTVGNVLSVGASSVPNQTGEGLWTGTLNSGYTVNALILENGEYYTTIGQTSGSNFIVSAFDYGSYITVGNVGQSYFREFYPNGTSNLGSGIGQVNTGVSLNGTVALQGYNAVSLNLTPFTTSSYNYNQAANINDIAGSWSGYFFSTSNLLTTFNINSNGTFTGSASTCTFTGTITPRPSGKNVFNSTITNGSGCINPGLVQTGIAISYITSTGKRQLIASGLDSTKSIGNMYLAQR